MPRHFLHVRTKQGPVIPDQIGIEFRNLAAARADAAEAVRQTIAEKKATALHSDVAGARDLSHSVDFEIHGPTQLLDSISSSCVK